MEKIITMLFESEAKASEAFRELKLLETESGHSLGETVMLYKDPDEQLILRDEVHNQPEGTLTGTLVGGLIGLLGGLPGLLIGMAGGSLVGAASDAAKYDFSEDYIKQVGRQMNVNQAAIVAHIWEDWHTPLDNLAEKFGARLNRSTFDETTHQPIEDKIRALDGEIEELELRLEKAEGGMRSNIQERINDLKDQRKDWQRKVTGQLVARKRLYQRRLDKLQQQPVPSDKAAIEEEMAQHRERLAQLEIRRQQIADRMSGSIINQPEASGPLPE